MGRRHEPIERKLAKAKGDGRTPSKLPVHVRAGGVAVGHRIPPVPRGMGPRGKTEWRKVWTAGRAWLHEDQDYHWVEMIARAYSAIEEFRAVVEKEGLTVQGYKNDMIVAHPLLGEITKQQQLIIKCLSVLGFSPTDRARLGLAEAKAQNAVLDMMNRRVPQ